MVRIASGFRQPRMPNVGRGSGLFRLRQDTAGVVKRAAASGDPVFITQRGRAAAVMMRAQTYERTQHELEILRLLARGEVEIEVGGAGSVPCRPGLHPRRRQSQRGHGMDRRGMARRTAGR
ncbi:MAG: type II toxin-antitoxin system Phd/YefM family antitoxin [Thermoleophilia bacterium]